MTGMLAWPRGYVPTTQTVALTPYRPPEPSPSFPTAPMSLQNWWREMRNEVAPTTRGPVESAVMCLRQNGEGALIGALLALIDTELGGLDLGGRLPLDWVGSAVFNALSIRDSSKPEGLSVDFRAMGQSCTTIATYRMVHKWRESVKGMPQNIPQTSGDPVLAAGKRVEF